jgi:hypothetical protein
VSKVKENQFYFLEAYTCFNPLNAELNPICHLLALLEAHHILHFSRIRVNIIFVTQGNVDFEDSF